MPPRENFRNFEMPWTTFHAFSWWRKRESRRLRSFFGGGCTLSLSEPRVREREKVGAYAAFSAGGAL